MLLTSEHTIVSKSFAHEEILATTGGPASTPLKQLAESLASITKLETAGFSGENDFLYFPCSELVHFSRAAFQVTRFD